MRGAHHQLRNPQHPIVGTPVRAGVVCAFLLLFFLSAHDAISAGIAPDAIATRTNAARRSAAIHTLRFDPILANAAQKRAEEIAASGPFDHVRPDGSSFATVVSPNVYDRVGENLAIDFLRDAPIIGAWHDSPSHRANLLGTQYQRMGVGVASGIVQGLPTIVVVELFGSNAAPDARGWKRLPAALPTT